MAEPYSKYLPWGIGLAPHPTLSYLTPWRLNGAFWFKKALIKLTMYHLAMVIGYCTSCPNFCIGLGVRQRFASMGVGVWNL